MMQKDTLFRTREKPNLADICLYFQMLDFDKLAEEVRVTPVVDFNSLGFRSKFLAVPHIYTGHSDILDTSIKAEPQEVVLWLDWLINEQANYTDPSQYCSEAPLKFLASRKSRELNQKTSEARFLREWGKKHVLLDAVVQCPYIVLQSHSSDALEIYWNFFNHPFYTNKEGKVLVSKEQYAIELENEKNRVGNAIFNKFPALMFQERFKSLL